MRIKLSYLLIFLCLFILAFVFKKYQFFPYKIVHKIYLETSNHFHFSKNRNCLMSNNLGTDPNGKQDYTFFIQFTLYIAIFLNFNRNTFNFYWPYSRVSHKGKWRVPLIV